MSKTILLVSATKEEIEPALEKLGVDALLPPGESKVVYNGHLIRIVITGVGMLHTAFHLAEALHRAHADVILNVGIAGALDHSLNIGETVWVVAERVGDMGALGPEGFEDIADMGFADKNRFPYQDGWLKADVAKDDMGWYDLMLKRCAGLTLNSITGTQEAIDRIKSLYPAQVESMEGAAVFYAGLYWNIPVYQLRSISNYVEVLDRLKWDIPMAIAELNRYLAEILDDL